MRRVDPAWYASAWTEYGTSVPVQQGFDPDTADASAETNAIWMKPSGYVTVQDENMRLTPHFGRFVF